MLCVKELCVNKLRVSKKSGGGGREGEGEGEGEEGEQLT